MARARRVTAAPAGRTDNTPVVVGLEFRSVHADSNSLWKVVRARGRDTWECEIIPEHEPHVVDMGDGKKMEFRGDYIGTRKVFGGEEIRRSVGLVNLWDELRRKDEDWLATLRVGQIVHHCDTRPNEQWDPLGNWTRHRVTAAFVPGKGVEMECLGYCGTWRNDLNPKCGRIHANGHVHYSFESKLADVGKRRLWQGGANMVFESPDFSAEYRQACEALKVDPSKLPLIDMTLPALTPAEAACKFLHDQVGEIKKAMENTNPGLDLEATPREEQTRAGTERLVGMLNRVRDMAAQALASHAAMLSGAVPRPTTESRPWKPFYQVRGEHVVMTGRMLWQAVEAGLLVEDGSNADTYFFRFAQGKKKHDIDKWSRKHADF